MGTPSSGPRADLPYLRRRVRRVPLASDSAPAHLLAPVRPPTPADTGSQAAAVSSSHPVAGLTLGAPGGRPREAGAREAAAPVAGMRLGDDASAAKSMRPQRPQPFPAPGIGDTRDLDERTPVLRLDRRRSAVGTLIITGASSIAWESTTFLSGAAMATGETVGSVIETSGNRPLLDFDDGAVLVTLRHVRELRRALILGRETDALGLRLFDGSTLSVPTGAPESLTIVQLLVVDGLLELRAEPVDPAWSDTDVHREFGFSMTHQFALPSDGA